MNIAITPSPAADWDTYVAAQGQASVYHSVGWAALAAHVFAQRACFIEARDDEARLIGVLPLVQQRSLLFGRSLTSLPYFNYGGALGDSPAVVQALMDRAKQLAVDTGCRYIELRDVQQQPGDWLTRTDKVTLLMDLPASVAALAQQLGAKLRSQTRRADRESPLTRVGGLELLDDFYDVFCRNMHALGTPVYPKRFFAALLKRFADSCVLLVISTAEGPMAAGFLVIARGRAEIPWASCREEAKPRGFNMKLYWEALSLAIERGCSVFDFGRSSADSGTYRFKTQWGAKPVQLYWHRWERNAAAVNPELPAGSAPAPGKLRTLLTAVWMRLPLPVANFAGPLISPGLPW